MSSYKNYLPKTSGGGGGGVDVIGSVIQLPSAMDDMVSINGNVYLKEGAELKGSKTDYAEAFEKLSGKGGKSWESVLASAFTSSTKFRGIFNTEAGFLAVATRDQDVYVYKVDPERSTVQQVLNKKISGSGQIRSQAVYHNRCIWMWADGRKLIGIKPSDLGAFAEITTSISGMTSEWGYYGIPYNDDVILWTTGKGFVYVAVTDNLGVNQGACYSVNFESSFMVGTFTGGVQFTGVDGKKVTLLHSNYGEVFWYNGTSSLNAPAAWTVRVSAQDLKDEGFYGNFSAAKMVVSPEADVVYVVDAKGQFLMSNGLFDIPVTYGQFPGYTTTDCSWGSVDGDIFFFPGGKYNTYQKLDKVTKTWQCYKYGDFARCAWGTEMYATSIAKSGDTIIHYANLSNVLSGSFGFMISTDKVKFVIDPNDGGNISNFVRVK